MLREYVISEAMFALGIPTTRSLAVVTTGEPVYRESTKKGAILTRVAASHIRVGTFEFLAARRDEPSLRLLADYSIHRHYPELTDAPQKYLAFLRAVIDRQASLIAKWQLVGFIHGVMNTDNMVQAREKLETQDVAIVRLEQLHPLSSEELTAALESYPEGATVCWVQEEPSNMGAANYVNATFREDLLKRFAFQEISRAASASPATGSTNSHKLEQHELIAAALPAKPFLSPASAKKRCHSGDTPAESRKYSLRRSSMYSRLMLLKWCFALDFALDMNGVRSAEYQEIELPS